MCESRLNTIIAVRNQQMYLHGTVTQSYKNID